MTKVKVRGGNGAPTEGNLRPVTVGEGLPSVDDLHDELQHMFDVMLDRVRLPIDYSNSIALMEVADAFHSRAQEIKFMIHSLERAGEIKPRRRGSDTGGDPLSLFRTGELEDFITATKETISTGSRRLSAIQHEFERSIRGISGWGN